MEGLTLIRFGEEQEFREDHGQHNQRKSIQEQGQAPPARQGGQQSQCRNSGQASTGLKRLVHGRRMRSMDTLPEDPTRENKEKASNEDQNQ